MTSIQQQLHSAFAKHQSGDVDGAIALYREVLSGEPQQPDALHMLGVAAQQKGNPELALKLIDAALTLKPSLPLAAHNRSLVLLALGRKEEAMKSSERATLLDPQHAEAWNMRGILARELNGFAQAFTYHKHAIQLQPDDLKLQSEYALSLYVSGDLLGAYKIMSDVVARDTTIPPLTLANILKSAGYPERAMPYLRRARELLPQNAEVIVNEAVALLQMGDFAQGFALWEQRPDIDTCFQHTPLWKGEAVNHLLVCEDQGVGDSIQFFRYVPLLCEKAARVTIQIPKMLQKLAAANLSGIDVITTDEKIPVADARVRLASLPFLFGTRLETIFAAAPYLQTPEEWRAPWRGRLAQVPGPRIGLVWSGNPDNHNDRNRSIPFAQLAPIVEVGGAHLVSLQKGVQKSQADLSAAKIFDADPYLEDFAATAGLLAELDLIITVCTAPVHLAGAMGRPAWLMLCFDPHWVWMLGREDSPWYPDLRIFRQSAPGDWSSVAANVAGELRKFIAGDREVLKPAKWDKAPLRQNPNAIDMTDS